MMKAKNSIVITLLVAVLVSAVAFYGGIQYQKSQRGTFAGRTGDLGAMQRRTFTRPITGEIISQDDASITVKLQNGSTKIVILSDKTTINKASTGAKSDLKTGEKVSAFGIENSDGSITAQTVSLGGIFRGMGSQSSPSGQPSHSK